MTKEEIKKVVEECINDKFDVIWQKILLLESKF